MEVLEFLSRLIDSLVWPVTVVGIIFIMRGPLRDLLPLVHRLKLGDFELEFRKRVEEVKAEVELQLPKEAESTRPTAESQAIFQLAEMSPRSAVLEAWRGVELAALDAARRLGTERFTNRTLTFQAIRFLEQQPSLDHTTVALLRDLRGLRNEAAHAPDFALTVAAALEYVQSAEALVRYMNGLGNARLGTESKTE